MRRPGAAAALASASMTSPRPRAILALVLLATAAGCGGGGARQQAAGAPQPSGPPPSEPYNADQLAQALLTDVPGYARSGPPQRGPYGSLPAVQSTTQMQQATTIDKPQCANTGRAVAAGKDVQTAPSALALFAKGGDQTATETLMTVGPDIAAQEVGQHVPAACRTFHAHVGGRWATDTVVEARGARIGEGSRTVGVATAVGTTTVRTWSVVLRSRGYLATVTLFGPGATRAQAESLARRAYQQAERILP